MSTAAPELQELGDKIANLTLKQAKELSDYIKDTYGIEPAASIVFFSFIGFDAVSTSSE